MKVKTAELDGIALDWAVARIEGDELPKSGGKGSDYSTDWAHGGPIIERENISVGYQGHLGVSLDSLWYATNRADACGFGQTPLSAAMRCYVAGKLGESVEVPEELFA